MYLLIASTGLAIITLFEGVKVKKTAIARATALAVLAGLFVGLAPANAVVIRVPKTAMQACAVAPGIYCVESVTVTDSSGKKIPLLYVPSGADVPQQKTPSDFFAPVARMVGGKVVQNDWWMSQYQRDPLTSGKLVVQDQSALLGTANFPEQGAIYDPVTKKFDINKPEDTYAQPVDCWDPVAQKGTQKPFSDCFKGANVFLLDNTVQYIYYYPTPAAAASENKNFKAATFIDLAELSALQQRPTFGATYDAATKTFSSTESIVIPLWVTQNALVNGWAVAGTVATVPTVAATGAGPFTNTPCSAAELAGTTGVGIPETPSHVKLTIDAVGVKVWWDAPTGPAPASYTVTGVNTGAVINKSTDVGAVSCVILTWDSFGATGDKLPTAANRYDGFWFWVGAVATSGTNSGFKAWVNDAYAENYTDPTGALTPPLSPDPATTVGQPAEAGRVLPGRWTSPNWQGLNLGSLGYDGLYVEAKSANEFTNILMIDVLPTLTGADKKVNLAGQVGNKAYATSLDPDVVISVKVRTGQMTPGVTVAIGADVVINGQNEGEYTSITMTGTAVTVPLAAKAADCTGEAGISKANVRQFQAIVLPSNDDMSGFGVDGTSGDMYIGSNGVCSLSTPTWDNATKSFSWQTSAPHFAPDGVTVNRGFYKAIIPTGDAAILWGMTNPNDAATALSVSVSTEAGGSTAAISKISVKNGKIIIDVSGFQFSRPKLRIGLKPGYKASKPVAKASTVTCVMGKTTKKVTAVSPKCPAGYKKK